MNTDCKHGIGKAFCALCNPSNDIHFSLTAFSRRHHTLDSKELAEKALEKMSTLQKNRLLLSLIKREFDSIRRGQARGVETSSSSSYFLERQQEKKEKKRFYIREVKERYVKEREEPWKSGYGKAWDEWAGLLPTQRKLTLQKLDPGYLKWMEDGSYYGSDDYLVSYNSYSIDRAFKNLESHIRTEVTLNLTEELLGSSFSGANGSVTWGNATVTDHAARVDFLLTQAGSTVETAKLHKVAIKMLTDKHVSRLNEVADRGAKAA